MPKAVQSTAADASNQPRRSSRTTTREQTLQEKEAKKAEEAQILASLPPGQKYFYLGPDGKPVLEPRSAPVSPAKGNSIAPAATDFSTSEATDQQEPPWLKVSHKKPHREYGRRKNQVGRKTSTASPSASTNTSLAHSANPNTEQASVSRKSTPPRPSGDVHSSYAAAVKSKNPPVPASASKRPRSDSSATAARVDGQPVAKKPRVPPVTANRRVELADAAETRSRQELGVRKASAKSLLETGVPAGHHTAVLENVAARREIANSPARPSSIALAVHTSRELDTRKADRKAALLAQRAGPPSMCAGSSTSAPSTFDRGRKTAAPVDNIDTNASSPIPAPTDSGLPSTADSSDEDHGGISGSSPALDSRILSPSPAPDSRTLSPSPAVASRVWSPSPSTQQDGVVVPFSNGWEDYDSEEDRAKWARSVPSSSVRLPTRESALDVPLHSLKRIVGIPPPFRSRPDPSGSAKQAPLSATRLPTVQLPHEALRRSNDPLYGFKPEHRVVSTHPRHNAPKAAHKDGRRAIDLGGPVVTPVVPQPAPAPSRGTSSKPGTVGHMPISSRNGVTARAESAYIEDIPDSDPGDATSAAAGSGRAPARRFRHTQFFPEPLDGDDLHEQLIRPDPYPTKKGGRKGYLYPALKYSTAVVDGAEELLTFKNSMARDFECLDDTLSKPVAAKRRPQLVRSLFRAGQHLAEIGPSIVLAIHMQLDGASGIDAWTNPHTRFHLPGLVDEVVHMVHSRTADLRAELSASSASITTSAARSAQKDLEQVESGASYGLGGHHGPSVHDGDDDLDDVAED